jgi:uncharacterized protein (TIGR03435 family)
VTWKLNDTVLQKENAAPVEESVCGEAALCSTPTGLLAISPKRRLAKGSPVFPAIAIRFIGACSGIFRLSALDTLGGMIVLGSRDVTMDVLTGALSMLASQVGRPVIDKTGLTWRFDFTVEWGVRLERPQVPMRRRPRHWARR